jgi:hypothetical protein
MTVGQFAVAIVEDRAMWNSLLKVGAVASSLLLVSGFVAYRAGAFDLYFRPADPFEGIKSEIMSGSKSDGMFEPSAEYVSPTVAGEEQTPSATMIYSTKSAPIFEEPLQPTVTAPETSNEKANEQDPFAEPEAPTTTPAAVNDRVIQAGSKAMVLDLQPPNPKAPPQPAQPTNNPGKSP